MPPPKTSQQSPYLDAFYPFISYRFASQQPLDPSFIPPLFCSLLSCSCSGALADYSSSHLCKTMTLSLLFGFSPLPSFRKSLSFPFSPRACANPAPVENLVVIGSGPAGYTAAIYAGRANLKPFVLEGLSSGVPGGQLMTTADVENFPGFPDGISGPSLMAQMRQQAERWGAELVMDDAIDVDLDTHPFRVRTSAHGERRANTVIVATGASAKRLRVRGEEDYWGKGISACAVCDGAAPMFAGGEVIVVGGGDSACEEAVYLCKYVRKVRMLVRGDTLRASKTLRDRVMNHPSVSVELESVVAEAVGKDGRLQGVKVKRKNGEEELVNAVGMFYAIGHNPNTGFLKGTSRMRFDEKGYVVTEGGVETGLGGVFAAGDVADKEWRQAVTAAGSGCMAALAAERWLTARGLVKEYHHKQDEDLAPSQAEMESRESEEEKEKGGVVDDETTYRLEDTWHTGQYALRKLYHESKRPLIVKYISPSCGPCRQLKPMLHAVVRALEGRVHYVEIDITRDVEIAEAAGVTGSPTVQIFKDKALINEFKGVKMKSEYKRVVERLLQEENALKQST